MNNSKTKTRIPQNNKQRKSAIDKPILQFRYENWKEKRAPLEATEASLFFFFFNGGEREIQSKPMTEEAWWGI